MTTPPIVVRPHDVVPGPPRRVRASARRERARLRRAEQGPVNVSLWVPTTVLFALLAPFALLITPFLYLAPRRVVANPALMMAGLGALLLSLGGTVVEVDTPDAHVRLRLF